MKVNDIEVREGQKWLAVHEGCENTVEIVCVRRPPYGSARAEEIAAYIEAAHKVVMIEDGDLKELLLDHGGKRDAYEDLLRYFELTVELHVLIAQGKIDSEEANAVRDEMDTPWWYLQKATVDRLNKVGARLNDVIDIVEGKEPIRVYECPHGGDLEAQCNEAIARDHCTHSDECNRWWPKGTGKPVIKGEGNDTGT